MKELAFSQTMNIASNRISDAKSFFKPLHISIDTVILTLLLVLANMHLIFANNIDSMIFLPLAVSSGQWWRIITHPFAHVSWYHLLLNAGAFFLLYYELDKRPLKRVYYTTLCGIGSLLAALFASPMIFSAGLCGLSGISHGLMAITGLDLMRDKDTYKLGLVCFLIVVSKSMYEAITGDVIFSFMHFGTYGTPLAVCHAGGVLGGVVAFYLGNGFILKRQGGKLESIE